jgi:hypothetical protein
MGQEFPQEENVPQEKIVDRERVSEMLDTNTAYVKKLAEDENMSDEEAVAAIANVIADTMIQTERPEFLDYLDTSAKKHATEKGRERLERAITSFIDKYSETK